MHFTRVLLACAVHARVQLPEHASDPRPGLTRYSASPCRPHSLFACSGARQTSIYRTAVSKPLLAGLAESSTHSVSCLSITTRSYERFPTNSVPLAAWMCSRCWDLLSPCSSLGSRWCAIRVCGGGGVTNRTVHRPVTGHACSLAFQNPGVHQS